MRCRFQSVLIGLLIAQLAACMWVVRQSREWQAYKTATATVAAHQEEVDLAMSLSDGSRRSRAGQRHAELRLKRQITAAREKSLIYRVLTRPMDD